MTQVTRCESRLELASDLVWQNKRVSASIDQTGKIIITASYSLSTSHSIDNQTNAQMINSFQHVPDII